MILYLEGSNIVIWGFGGFAAFPVDFPLLQRVGARMEGGWKGGVDLSTKTLGIDRKMTELASSIPKQCLLPQTTAGTAGNRPHHRGSFFGWLVHSPVLDP